MVNPLPSVTAACAMLQQEESQREILTTQSYVPKLSAMMGKTALSQDKPPCTVCGGKGHSSSYCWTVNGYPRWHYKYKPKP